MSRLINLRVCSCTHGCSNLQVAGARLIQKFLCTNFIFIQFLVTLAEKKNLPPRAIIVRRKLRLLPIRKQRKLLEKRTLSFIELNQRYNHVHIYIHTQQGIQLTFPPIVTD